MENLHIPGKIVVKENGDACTYRFESADGNWLMAFLHNGEAVLARQFANINRMAMCWNYFDGTPTKDIPASIKELEPQTQKFHIIHTSSFGPTLVSFNTDEERQEWCSTQDDSFESFFAVDGDVKNVYTPTIGE